MIVFKNNEISVEDPEAIQLNGVYYGIIINSVQVSNNLFHCYIYIPEVYGPFDHIYNNTANYPVVKIPFKQDNDDEGHVPQTGELVKVSFNNGSSTDCQFVFLVPIGEEQRIRNALYITDGIIPADIYTDINDPDLLNKIKSLVKYAYEITLNDGSNMPSSNKFKINCLTSCKGYNNYFLTPLMMPLTAQYSQTGNESNNIPVPVISSVIYLLADIITQFVNSEDGNINRQNALLELWNNPPEISPGILAYQPDSLSEHDDKIYAIASLLSGIPTGFAKVIFPEASDNVVEWSLNGGFQEDIWYRYYTLYRLYENETVNPAGKLYYDNISLYENEWAKTMVSWMTGINAIVKDPNNLKLKIAIAFCFNLCPWMAPIVIGYNESDFDIQQRIVSVAGDNYENLQTYFDFNKDNSYSILYTHEEFIEVQKRLYEAIREEKIKNFISEFRLTAKEAFSCHMTNGVSSWEECDMDEKFNRLLALIDQIADDYSSSITVPGGSAGGGTIIIGGNPGGSGSSGGSSGSTGQMRYFDIPLSHDLQLYIYNLCTEQGVPFELMLGLMKQESGFNVNAQNVNANGTIDTGLCQINSINADWLRESYGITNLWDPYQNAKAGIMILGGHYRKYHDANKAAMCYNLGEGGAISYWNQGITSTQHSRNVVQYYNEFLSMP